MAPRADMVALAKIKIPSPCQELNSLYRLSHPGSLKHATY